MAEGNISALEITKQCRELKLLYNIIYYLTRVESSQVPIVYILSLPKKSQSLTTNQIDEAVYHS